MALGEFELIQCYFNRNLPNADVVVGIGDDCAVLDLPSDAQLAVSIDTQVEGVHFLKETPAKAIATRALGCALSDLAAMGARPLWLTLALTLPDVDEAWLTEFSDGVLEICDKYGLSLVGGDTTKGPLTVTVQVHGCLPKGKALRRSGAQPDDLIYVTGSLGDGAAALAVLNKQLTVSTPAYDYLVKRFYRPKPLLQQGELLLGIASACIDISDGLLADLNHICSASGTGALIDISRLPIADCWKSYVSEDKRDKWALAGGDDYQLCFTLPRAKVADLDILQREGRIQATAIGKMTHKSGIVLVKQGKPVSFDVKGYDHFGPG